MNLKHTALMTLLMLLLQHTGFVFTAVSLQSTSTHEWADTQSHHASSELLQASPNQSRVHKQRAHQSTDHHHEAIDQTDSAAMHHEDGQHCEDCRCCGVLGCYVAVNVFDLALASMAPGVPFPDSHFIYAGTNPAGLYRPPSFL